tara:strand:- start:3346 stop:3594 length:249 start_codon:yes stop_codon:yes gene_type:complete
MKEAKNPPTRSESRDSREVLKVLNKIERHLASLVYYQQPSRSFGASIEKSAAMPYISEGNESREELRAMIAEELQKIIEEIK